MSITTNIYSLPEPIVKALAYDEYSRGEADISVTGLITPPQLAWLYDRHEAEVEEDISERTWLALGKAIHILFERHAEVPLISEERLYMPCQGWTVSGQPDLRPDLIDYKSTSVWTVVYSPLGREDWHAQLNMYALLCHHNGYPVEKATVIALLRDWQKGQAAKGGKYPPIPWAVIDIPLWPQEEAVAYMTRRGLLPQAARGEGRFEDCTAEERWQNERTKKYARCVGYCPVSRWCPTLQREAGIAVL